jgi:RHS repeat-associated protein
MTTGYDNADHVDSAVAQKGGTTLTSYTYRYDPSGNTISSTGTVANPWQFTSAYFDSVTGLYKMGLRYYDPTQGRFTQQDPKVQWGNPNGWSRYAY